MIFNELYFYKLLIYTNNQIVKNYLVSQENSLTYARLYVRWAAFKMSEKNAIFDRIAAVGPKSQSGDRSKKKLWNNHVDLPVAKVGFS